MDAWEQEILRFWRKIEDFYGITITEEDVRKAIEKKNRERDVMLRFLELGKLYPAPISGYEMGSRLDSLGFDPDLDRRCRIIEERTREVIRDWEANYKGKPSRRPRILVTGCPNSGVREKVEKVDTTLPPARHIYEILQQKGYTDSMGCVATGYGRVCVDYADKVITEITCHGKGGWALFGEDGTVVDIGGQDTKVIHIRDGQVADFLMNDKCAAGTGKFIEVMASRLGTDLKQFYAQAEAGTPVSISAMCTVFAESEVIGHIGEGKPREDIAAGVIDSVAARVSNLVTRFGIRGELYLTGGLCDSPYFIRVLSQKTGKNVMTHPMARYAGALGAALAAAKQKQIDWSGI